MDKKSKIIMIVCIIVIVIAIGVATSIAIINGNREKIDLNTDKTTEIENEKEDKTPEYDESKDINVMDDEELDKLLN